MRVITWVVPTALLLICFSCVSSTARGQGPEAGVPTELVLQTGHSTRVASLAFSPDGRILASAGSDGRILLWEVATGRVLRRINDRLDVVSNVAFSPDGRWLASGADSRFVGKPIYLESAVWDVKTGERHSILRGAFGLLAFTPDGRVISGSVDHTLRLWDAETGLPLAALGGTDLANVKVQVSPDGHWLVCGCRNKAIEIRRLSDGAVLHTLGSEETIAQFALSPDGSLLAWRPSVRRLEVLDTKDWKRKYVFDNAGGDIAFSPDGRWLLTSSWYWVGYESRSKFQAWNMTTGSAVENTIPAGDVFTKFSFGPGEVLATGRSDSRIVLWSSPTGVLLRSFNAGSIIGAQAVRPDGKVFATGRSDGKIVIWSGPMGRPIASYSGNPEGIESLVFSPDGEFLASSSGSIWLQSILNTKKPPVLILDVHTGQQLGNIEAEGISSLAFGGKGQWLAVTGRTGVELRTVPSGQLMEVFEGHTKFPLSVAYSPDGRWLVSGGGDGTAILWNVKPKGSKQVIKTEPDNVALAIAFAPNSKLLALGANEKVMIWDVEHGSQLFRLEGHSAWVSALAFSPDGKELASGSWDHTIKIWDAQTGKLLHTLTGHTDTIRGLSFLSGGMLLSSSYDGTSRLWDSSSGGLVATLLSFGIKDWLVVTPQGFFDGTAKAMQLVAWRDSNTKEVVPLDTFYNDLFYPDLLAEIFAGKRPQPKFDIATRLRFPGLRTMAQQGYAHIEQRDSKTYLCLARQGSATSNKQVTLLRRGQPIDLVRDFTFDPQSSSCTYKKELPANEGPYELIGESDGWKYHPAETAWIKTDTSKSRLHVLTIGVNKYKQNNLYPPLRFSVADADAIKEFFTRQKTSDKKPFADIIVWNGLRDEKATKEAIQEQLTLMAKEAKEDDVVLLFFSGHGRVPPGQSMFYYIPYFPAQSDFSTLDEREVGLNTAMLAEAVREIPAKRVVLIIDACQSGGAVESLAKVGEVKVAIERRRVPLGGGKMGETTPGVGIYILAAATPVQEAAEPLPGTVPDNLSHGLLTLALLQALQEKSLSDNRNGITMRAVIERVKQLLPQLAKERRWVQTAFPVLVGNIDFPIAGR